MERRSWLIIVVVIISMLVACDNPVDNKVPTISFSAPANNSSFVQGEIITFSVEVDDPEEDMKEVRFYADNVGLGSDQSWPYSFDWETGTLDVGEYTIKAEAIDNGGAKSDTEITIMIETRSPPVASFTVDPMAGTTETVFNFDASGSSDTEDASDDLQMRWDWENDGTWDTDYSTTQIATHQYGTAGIFMINLEVMDSHNLTASHTETIIVENSIVYGSVTDFDGNEYLTVVIGDQEWMMENLKVTHYRDGTAITHVTDATAWAALTSEAYCIYNNNASNEVDMYGALYNWYAVNGDIDGSGTKDKEIAPIGWHVPSHTEWLGLVAFLGGNAVAGGKMKEAGTSHWFDPNTGATNESGLTALPGGTRIASGNYSGINSDGYFWSSTEYTSYAWYRNLISQQGIVTVDYVLKGYGFSVRCVKD